MLNLLYCIIIMQVRAVYHVMLELIRRLREEDSNISREAAFHSFAGHYLIQVRLSVNMRTLFSGIVVSHGIICIYIWEYPY